MVKSVISVEITTYMPREKYTGRSKQSPKCVLAKQAKANLNGLFAFSPLYIMAIGLFEPSAVKQICLTRQGRDEINVSSVIDSVTHLFASLNSSILSPEKKKEGNKTAHYRESS